MPNDQPVRYDRHGEIAVITVANPPVNALGLAVRQGLWAAMDRFDADDARIAVIVGEGALFLGGADIREFGKPPVAPHLPDVCDRIEAAVKPVIAAVHGPALGGGCEVALGAHYRLAVTGARFGFPEVHLGLIPGAGGSQRMPRLTGVAPALEMMCSGAPISAPRALEIGLIDRVAEGDPRKAGIAYAGELLAEGAGVRRTGALPCPTHDAAAFAEARAAWAKKAKGQVAPLVAIDAVEAATRMDLAEGIKEERRLFLDLMQTPQRAGMIHAFFNDRKVSKLPELQGISPRPLDRIGVIGGGTMGAGIATACLLAGLPVTLIERDAASADKARATITGNLDAAVKRGKLKDAAATLSGLSTATDYAALSDVDLVIEAVFEDMGVKKEVFTQLDAVLKPGAILATNTSYLDVTEIAAATSRPQDVIGLHFFSPAHVMKLLEVVVPETTAKDVTATAFALAKRLKKTAVKAGVCDGFIGNRILATYRGAADRMILGGATPWEIDAAIKDFGLPMGPFEMGDLAGLDIGFMTRARKAATRDPRDIVPIWADEMYHKGWLGQKTGQGYYTYEGRKGTPNEAVMPLIETAREGRPQQAFTPEMIQRRYMAAMVNEAAKVVGEGIAARPLDVDVTLLYGYGFPRWRGGPMLWADTEGLPGLLADIQGWAKDDPYFWQPAPLLEQLVAEGRTFSDLNEATS
ncbi:3-hydroxyacyl-CoA dehydrogenase NAD-binding domain-containing protein [Tropicibacter naphthalenivorans]|uniref:Fatty acid oxidation complex subunit alpha n=1 Tax=Tropicibacter naphthalenivorans TaxID=441103 RepID=A0A0P1GXZ4_9RHOB|nr:3-hydroxyacyl-CoA dehydrogenase NAD-binding domain-containing protein [Tropicibacter naphthalenivorans]CUH81654.1 Fatty acid oxidation complex subunit alpha [Tropicibacter naphthalenivorans]SMC99443.1 3-hydroxyacyl-CoA dehydrogenase [Tropicibacter naphthalenivorans]